MDIWRKFFRKNFFYRVDWRCKPLGFEGDKIDSTNDLLESALDRYFGGGRNWYFIAPQNKPESTAIYV